MTTKTEDIPFVHRYAIKYYSFLIQQVLSLALAFWSHNMPLVMFFAIFHNVFCYLIPVTDYSDPKYSKQVSKNVWAMGPCVISCLMTPTVLAIFWVNYDVLIGNSIINYFSAIMALVFLVGGSIDASHELLHRPETIFKAISYFNLFFYQFTVYPIEHLYLHHKKVGTPHDPITSPKGQTINQYYVNAIASAYKFNYQHDRTIFWACLSATIGYNVAVILMAVKEGSGMQKALFFSLFSYASLYLMEATQYVEHYGLVYRQQANSQPLQICSWNTKENPYLSLILFKFQKHSDHHMNAHKMFSIMEMNDKMPQFPFDFGNAMLFAPFSKLWFKIADPLVDEIIEKKSVSKQHMQFIASAVNTQRLIVCLGFFSTLLMQVTSN